MLCYHDCLVDYVRFPFTYYFQPPAPPKASLYESIRTFTFTFCEPQFPSTNLVNRDNSNTFLPE